MSWQLTSLLILGVVLAAGGLWFERSRPSARIVAAVAALAALGIAGRLILAPIPNVVATTDVALITGYVLGGPPGFAVGALAALISNFWLGQGPWTPWQMAGWGMVGVGGAVLARVAGRELGRVALAIAAGVAGLAYGALLDLSAMVNFGGEQSLERYVALSVRGIPFNIAHAVGNAAIMLAAGPALVRIVDRYRDRFEVDWAPRPAPGGGAARAGLATLLIGAGIGLGLLGGGPAAPSEAAAAEAGVQERSSGVADARSWLRKAQNDDGGFGTGPDFESSPGMTGWAILGLEAAGVNPLAVRSGGNSAVGYLRGTAGEIDSTADLERTILALRGAGLGVRGFGGKDLLAELRERQSDKGSYEKQVNLTAFAILARRAAGDSKDSLSEAGEWLRKAQNKDGGWGSTEAGASEPDSTGAALQALDILNSRKTLDKGVRWLKRAQNRDGGWSLVAGSDSNSQSTAWAIQGLVAAGADPGVSKGSKSGFDYLAARRQRDGSYAYSKSSTQTPVWVTAQALTALTREPFPIAAVKKPQRAGGDNGGSGNGSGDGGTGSAGTGSTGTGSTGGFSSGGFSPGAEPANSAKREAARDNVAATAGEAEAEPEVAPEQLEANPVTELLAEQDAAAEAAAGDEDEGPNEVLLVGIGAVILACLGGIVLNARRLGY